VFSRVRLCSFAALLLQAIAEEVIAAAAKVIQMPIQNLQ